MLDCKPLSTPMTINEKPSKYDGKEKMDGSTYRSLVRSLIYLTNTLPDIVYGVSIISRFMSECSKAHFVATKRILRYIKGIKNYGLLYKREKDARLVGCADSD